MFLFHQSTIYIAIDKCFYICDAVVVKSLYITFLIHRKVCIPSPCINNNYRIWLFENFGRILGLLSCEVWRLWLPNARKLISLMLTVFSKSDVLRTEAPFSTSEVLHRRSVLGPVSHSPLKIFSISCNFML